MDTIPSNKVAIIKNIYLYLVSFVALMMIIFSAADMLNIALRTYIFTKADDFGGYYGYPVVCPETPTSTTGTPDRGKGECITEEEQKKRDVEMRSSQKQRDLVRDISFILVAAPVFAYHWRIVRKREEV